ncbi:MAG TPA: hypothetical protein VF494_10995 [Candidatus Limnocylindrales bacterium]
MSEILTESFCERCGTRYTFESARPKIRLKGVKVLSRGLKNFVLSDDTTMDEAMAAARSETDREATAHQLDAFHKTFNFCMSCRQYTCPNCWNEVEARCQSCAPLPERELADHEVVPPAFPGLVTLAGATAAEPAPNGANGHDHVELIGEPAADAAAVSPEVTTEPAAKATSQTAGLFRRFRPGQSLDDELAAFERERSDAQRKAPVEPEGLAQSRVPVEPAAPAEPAAPVETAPEVSEAVPGVVFETAAEATAETPIEAPMEPAAETPIEAIGAATAETVVEAAVEPIGDDLAAEPVEDTSAEPASGEPVSEAAPAEAAVEAAAASAESEPVAPTAADVVEQPTWRITAPDVEAPAAGAPARPDERVPLQATGPSVPPAEPQWPVRPEWPAPQASAGLPFLGRPAQPPSGVDSLWAASNRELVATPPAPGRSMSGIQPCISCGLSLSANARFCRRCGTLQGG